MARRKDAQWERYQSSKSRPGLWLSISPTGSVTLSRELVAALGVTAPRRGLALYRWPHDGEMLVKLEATDTTDGDFRVILAKSGVGHFNSLRFGGWLGLGESRSKKHTFDVKNLEGDLIFSARARPGPAKPAV